MKGVKILKDEKGKDIVQMSLTRWNQILEYLEDAAMVKEAFSDPDQSTVSLETVKKTLKNHAANLKKKSAQRHS
jgi:hypothetical protein